MKNPSQKILDLIPEIQREYGSAIAKGYMGRVAIEKEYNVSQEEARHIVSVIRENLEQQESIIFRNEDYDYNETKDVYTIYGRDGVFDVDGEHIRYIRRNYSNLIDGSFDTQKELAFKLEALSLREIKEIIRLMGITHDSSPLTDEEFSFKNEKEIGEELLRLRKIRTAKSYEKTAYKDVHKKAVMWDMQELMLEERRNELITQLTEYAPKTFDTEMLKRIYPAKEDMMVFVSPADIHFGKAASMLTTNNKYTMDITRKVVLETTYKALQRLSWQVGFSMIHLVVGNDWFHVDGYDKKTTNGTPQDVDGSPLQIMRGGKQLAVEVVNMCLLFAPKVRISMALANHDWLHGAGLLDHLEAYFHFDDRVEVNMSLLNRQYFKEGNTIIGVDHGHGAKEDNLPVLMAQEAKEMWGDTEFREFFRAHKHHFTTKVLNHGIDKQGIRIWELSSVSGTDEWHALKGYVESIRSIHAFGIHPERGLVGWASENVLHEMITEFK